MPKKCFFLFKNFLHSIKNLVKPRRGFQLEGDPVEELHDGLVHFHGIRLELLEEENVPGSERNVEYILSHP
jgi:hypothetical protein